MLLDGMLLLKRNVEFSSQQSQHFFTELKTQIDHVLQDFQHRQAIFVCSPEVSRVERITENVRVPELAIDARRIIVGLLIRC